MKIWKINAPGAGILCQCYAGVMPDGCSVRPIGAARPWPIVRSALAEGPQRALPQIMRSTREAGQGLTCAALTGHPSDTLANEAAINSVRKPEDLDNMMQIVSLLGKSPFTSSVRWTPWNVNLHSNLSR